MTDTTALLPEVDVPEAEDVYVFPASFAQQRLWFLDQFEPNSPYYNIPSAVRLRGRLNTDAFARAVNEIIRRHEALRTTFAAPHGTPLQIIAPSLTIPVPVEDLTALPPAEREAEAQRRAVAEARRPFNLATGPLLRVTLLKLGPEDHIALVTMHHIVSDGWSIGVFVAELAALYNAFSQDRPSPLPDLPIQYADFAAWQQEWLKGEVLEQHLAYWRQRLASADGSTRGSPVLELPADRPRPAVITNRGASTSIKIPKWLTEAVKQLSKQEGCTPFMTLLAAFQTLLSRYSGQTDISVGSPIANRNRAEIEGLIGVFINTLVFRTDLSGDPTFRQLLHRVREGALGAYAHQDLPFEMLVEKLQPERDMSHSPFFQVMFILQNAPNRAEELPGLRLEQLDVDMGTATFDLTLSMAEEYDGYDASVEYNTDIFDATTIARLLRHFRNLLEGAVAAPDQRISQLPLLSPAERQQILVEWNDTARDYLDGRPALLHELFEAQAARTPEATAVVFDGASLTYGELNERANQLAHYLASLGVGPETVVGIMAEKSLEVVIGVLGVLKAGGAYLPIDPAYPAERIAFMLEDSGARVVLTQENVLRNSVLRDSVVHEANAAGPTDTDYATRNTQYAVRNTQYVLLDRDWPHIARQPASNIPASSFQPPDTLAYVIYTSGSTGQAKGVMVSHRSIVNAYLAWEEAYRLRSDATAHLQMASFSFDVFTGDLVRALCSGGKLVLVPRELLLAPERLYALMRRERVDCAEFVPAVLRHLVQYLEDTRQNLDFMRLLVCGSDSWYVGEYQRFQRLCGPHTRLINSFGLTEATIDSCYFEGALHGMTVDRLVPIGRPFGNNQLYILDEHLQPVPIGVIGELYVGGEGVARGYLSRPDLTAERFVPDPFAVTGDRSQVGSGKLGQQPATCHLQPATTRLYRTGDLARWLPDGNVEFLGRRDYQVKIRGFRIEPGEIEAVLGNHPAVRQAVVAAKTAPNGDKRLVAYVVPAHAEPPESGELRRYLQDRLADYMVPSAFVVVHRLPLTPNGKVDRNALPDPDWTERGVEETYVAPRTPVEEVLARLWSDVLGVRQVGIHDNFFELGGHSLLATQVISRVRDAFGVELPLRNIFESPTVALLAEQVELAQRAAAGIQAPPIRPVPRDRELPLSFAQQRLWFLDQLEPNSPFYNLPEAVRLSGPLDETLMVRCLNEVVRRHEALRTTFRTVDGHPTQVIAPSLTLSLPVVDLSHLPPDQREAEVKRQAQAEAQTPFDLAVGPLIRGKLLRLAADEHIILLTMHHIVGDDWSTSVLVQEIALLYNAFAQGLPSPLPELPIQYADFAAWQREWLSGDVLNAQINYWKEALAGLPPVLELPTDRPRPPVQTFAGDYITFRLPVALSRQVRNLCQREGVTLFMALLAAFQTLLHRYSGQEDFAVGTPIANRNRADIEGLIGFFVNTLVLRGRFGADGDGSAPTFRQVLRRVRETALAAYAHQDLPFEMVVDALQPERNLAHSPLFQVMFALQNAPLRAQELPQIRISPVEAHSGTAKFDLTLFMIEEGEQLSGALEFNTDLFDRATAERMASHFGTLLESIVADPAQPVDRLNLLGEQERRQLLVEWNNTAAPFPEHLTAHQLFEAQVERTPDAVAVRFGEQTLTYKQLNARANRLAHFLRELGVGPDVLVAISVERSLEMPIGILGILKAGGAYLPIDPTYPAERIAFMLEDSGAQVLLTQENVFRNSVLRSSVLRNEDAAEPTDTDYAIRSTQYAIRNTHYILLDRDWPQIARYPDTQPPASSFQGPDNLAYIIYTSGSTGRPKGVEIHHRGLVNYLTWCQRAYPLAEGSGAPVHSSFSFDLTITGLFAPLVTGGTVTLLPEGLSIEILRDALQGTPGFSLVKITPAHLELLGHQLEPAQAASATRSFVIGGENLLPEHIAFWQQHAPDARLFNEYGPTETVVGCCVYEVPRGARFEGAVPIGVPIINTQLYVLDRHMQPTPIGVPGELYIGGAGVARGYHNRPELTAERFVPNPFAVTGDRLQVRGDRSQVDSGKLGQQPSTFNLQPATTRLYRTGDLARWRNDGNLEFLGRVDDQVKVRGFRIELGEIEAVLAEHPAVKTAVVIVREDTPGDKRLAAYIVPATAGGDGATGDRRLPVAELRAFLAGKLPDYMVPALYVAVDAIPLTPNGKVDRRGLARQPLPATVVAVAAGPSAAPATPEAEIIEGIFAQILNLAQVGAQDNFFDLGGHSLLATQVISRIRDTFGVELPLRALFEAPSAAALAEQVAEARRAAHGLAAPAIRPASRTGPLPLSFAQQRLWFLDQLEPGSPLYNIPAPVRLKGPLDVNALERSLTEVVRRHEALRTTFKTTDGRPEQVIADPLTLPPITLPVVDLRHLPAEEREVEAARQAMMAAVEPFDLAAGPLLRGHLWRLADDDHLALLNTHHIISDDWSLGILVAELAAIYATLTSEEMARASSEALIQRAGLRPLPVQYADYAVWQREWLRGEVLERQITYWKEQLAGLPPLLELPTDRPRPPIQTARGGQHTFVLPADLSEALKGLSREAGTTLFMTLLAGFQALLGRYSGQDDLAVGTPIANRTRSEIEGLIGFFVNTLVLRARLADAPTFRQLLKQVRETALGAYAHQDVPFETLVDALHPVRDMSHSPLFQAMFVLQNAPRRAQTLPTGLTLSPATGADMPTARFDLTLTVVEDGAELSGSLEYNADLFEPATIERMAVHLVTLLRGAVAEPDRPLASLPLLSEAERQQIVVEWNRTAAPLPADPRVHVLFEAQAGRTPDAPALLFAGAEAGLPDVALTYAELNARANQLAHHLRSIGVGPETVVAISVERSPEMIIGLLGTLKAGGAYLPVDPNYPAERIAFMLEDSGARVLLTQESVLRDSALRDSVLRDSVLRNSVPRDSVLRNENAAELTDTEYAIRNTEYAIRNTEYAVRNTQYVLLDRDWPAIAGLPTSQLPASSFQLPDTLAYVIYTSGSTGRPKGTLLQHAGLCNLVLAQIQAFGVTPADRVLQFASFSFDASVSETFMALVSGATLVLAPQAVVSSPADLSALMRARGITVVTLPPSLLKVLSPEDLPELRTVISAGERCTPEAIARWLPGRRVFNAYGPTETTVGPTLGQVLDLPEDAVNVPIGRPIANTQIYLLDRAGQPVPIGVAGEIYIGGIGVGRGYLGRPDLTAERFVPNPFAATSDRLQVTGDRSHVGSGNLDQQPSTFNLQPATCNLQPATCNLQPATRRLYRTGDLARWLPDGRIEYLRRIDDQVKVRGFRIELGEIEATLARHPNVAAAAVIVREDEPGQRRLVAYVVPAAEPATTVTELRSFLLESLPEYMVPAAFVTLDALPLTPSGKVNRRALPAPEGTRPDLAAAYVAPRTPAEETLAAIWAQVLGVDRVGIHDNFFELGGDSIISIQVIAQAVQAGLRLAPKDLFLHPTIAELAALAAQAAPPEEAPPAEQTPDLAQEFGWSQDDVNDILSALGDL